MKKILHQPWGGLGDNLQFSTLPERFSKLGYEVYISDKNAYRNLEIFELVWKFNPYVKGISNEPPNIGEMSIYRRIHPQKSIVYNQEACHKIEPENEIPKIYYKPKYKEEFKNIVIVNLGAYATKPFAPNGFSDFLRETFKGKKILIPKFNKNVSYIEEIIDFSNDGFVVIDSIFSYCDIIHSCFHFISSLSGQAVLASALNKKETTVFIKPEWKNIDWNFPNIEYQIVN